jgi:SAM-dependent methyltransferase
VFDTYADIFEKRGAAYHEAMRRFPTARDKEFGTMVDLLQPGSQDLIVDMPSGGGYLRSYFPRPSTQLIAVETTQSFFEQCLEDERTERRLCALDDTKLPTSSVDAVVSMAGMHHVDNRPAVFAEVHRILRPGGRFCVADVEEGSVWDDFLDTFVNDHSSMGHTGAFINDPFRSDLQDSCFRIVSDELVEYTWDFETTQEMITYCTLMFGLDKATPDQVEAGINTYQGYEVNNRCQMNWGLRFIRAQK